MNKLTDFERNEIAKKHALRYWGAGAIDNKLADAIGDAIGHAEKVLADKNRQQKLEYAAASPGHGSESIVMDCPSCGAHVMAQRTVGPGFSQEQTQISTNAWNEAWAAFDRAMNAFARIFG